MDGYGKRPPSATKAKLAPERAEKIISVHI